MQNQNAPWLHQLDKAAYAAQSVIDYLDSQTDNTGQKFASPRLCWNFQYISSFAYALPNSLLQTQSIGQTEANWLSSVLAKIAQRGTPAPCSLTLERHILSQAEQAGILTYRETTEADTYQFKLQPTTEYREDFYNLLKVAFYPELLVEDDELTEILQRYQTSPLSTPLEQDLFQQLLSRFPDPRLGLFVIPQRRIGDILAKHLGNAERPDFTIEIPSFSAQKITRLILEADDLTHQEPAQKQVDQQRDKNFNAGQFNVLRFPSWGKESWSEHLDSIAEQMINTITPELMDSALKFRTLPKDAQNAFRHLISQPVLEAQLLTILAQSIRQTRNTRLVITGACFSELDAIIESTNDTLAAVCKLADIHFDHGVEFNTDSKAGLFISSVPSRVIWECIDFDQGFLSSAPLRQGFLPTLLPGKPEPLDIDSGHEDQRAALEFLLSSFFRKVDFREGQLPILIRALTLRPVIGLLPTGAGKSLCYQFASLLQPGLTIVIDPLRSLMMDQHNNLQILGIHRAESIMFGANNTNDIVKTIPEGHYWFVFISPERLQRPTFLNSLSVIDCG